MKGHLVQPPAQNRVNHESDHIAYRFSQLGAEKSPKPEIPELL